MDKYQHPENPDKARADAERARSGAWGTHQDKRKRRARTRKAARRKDINDSKEQ